MGNSDHKAALLRSLAIDRSRARTAPRRWLMPTAVGGGSAAVIVVATLLLLQVRADRFTDGAATTPASASLQASAPAADPRPTGGLAASGYVVARRKATVAACWKGVPPE